MNVNVKTFNWMFFRRPARILVVSGIFGCWYCHHQCWQAIAYVPNPWWLVKHLHRPCISQMLAVNWILDCHRYPKFKFAHKEPETLIKNATHKINWMCFFAYKFTMNWRCSPSNQFSIIASYNNRCWRATDAFYVETYWIDRYNFKCYAL